jgi:hypothetical protein
LFGFARNQPTDEVDPFGDSDHNAVFVVTVPTWVLPNVKPTDFTGMIIPPPPPTIPMTANGSIDEIAAAKLGLPVPGLELDDDIFGLLMPFLGPESSFKWKPCPEVPYNRRLHYPGTPSAADRKALAAGPGQVVNHEPPLVTRYYEGDPKIGEKPGFQMSDAERNVSGNDRSRMNLQSQAESNRQGAEMSRYSQQQKQYHFP